MEKYNDMFCLECINYMEITEIAGLCLIDQSQKEYCSECDKPNKFRKENKNETWKINK